MTVSYMYAVLALEPCLWLDHQFVRLFHASRRPGTRGKRGSLAAFEEDTFEHRDLVRRMINWPLCPYLWLYRIVILFQVTF